MHLKGKRILQNFSLFFIIFYFILFLLLFKFFFGILAVLENTSFILVNRSPKAFVHLLLTSTHICKIRYGALMISCFLPRMTLVCVSLVAAWKEKTPWLHWLKSMEGPRGTLY